MEEQTTKTFSLSPILTDEKVIVIKDFEENKKVVIDYIEGKTLIEKIEDDETNKAVKADRTEIRKKLDLIKQARISIVKLYTGQFETQLKELEKLLSEGDSKLKALVDAYALSKKVNEPPKPKAFTLTVKGYDEKAINKIRDAAIKAGLSAELN